MTAIRYHTEGRRQPQIIGKDSSGKKLPGGPYTIYQVLGVVLIPALMVWLMPMWAGALAPVAAWLVVIPAVTITGVWLLGIPDFTRNPLFTAASGVALVMTPSRRPWKIDRVPAERVLRTVQLPPQLEDERVEEREPSVEEHEPDLVEEHAPDLVEPEALNLPIESVLPTIDINDAAPQESRVLSPLQSFLAAAGRS